MEFGIKNWNLHRLKKILKCRKSVPQLGIIPMSLSEYFLNKQKNSPFKTLNCFTSMFSLVFISLVFISLLSSKKKMLTLLKLVHRI